MAEIINLPVVPSTKPASWRDRVGLRFEEALGSFLNRSRMPGIVRPMIFDDPVTGDRVEIKVTPLRTVLSVNGRDYTFQRLSGAFVGTGMGCSYPTR